MGGHGGLNILPQKRWNVYNYENREKVRRDEEAAAKEEQLKQEQARKRDAESRLERLRVVRGLAPASQVAAPAGSESQSAHINLFEGRKDFDIIGGAEEEGAESQREELNKKRKKMMKMMREKEATPKVVTAEDEKYRLGYGIAGKGAKMPWYLARPSDRTGEQSIGYDGSSRLVKEGVKSGGKKTLQELREERLRREKQEKERERALILGKSQGDGGVTKFRGFSRR
ncbi:uncharacterized protein LOC131163731 [Malania oleifera]|uniref:uncharacterized protein LOC131163731 n=1 Tax=Malania oleifera TaxID=397392 RepID=UPI0025AE4BDD|nr:uncharacterized protein LOC131163731 [Malania oleifera]